jgi:hypothetical protein
VERSCAFPMTLRATEIRTVAAGSACLRSDVAGRKVHASPKGSPVTATATVARCTAKPAFASVPRMARSAASPISAAAAHASTAFVEHVFPKGTTAALRANVAPKLATSMAAPEPAAHRWVVPMGLASWVRRYRPRSAVTRVWPPSVRTILTAAACNGMAPAPMPWSRSAGEDAWRKEAERPRLLLAVAAR